MAHDPGNLSSNLNMKAL